MERDDRSKRGSEQESRGVEYSIARGQVADLILVFFRYHRTTEMSKRLRLILVDSERADHQRFRVIKH